VREDRPGDPHLAAYVTLDDGTSVSPAAVRRALLDVLPAYMVPDSIGVMHALPLSTNGKIDRRALASLPPTPAGGEHVLPRTPLEAQLVRIWEDVLGIAPIGVTDDFFALGATSLGAGRVFERIERELGATLPMSPIFVAPTVERLAALVEQASSRRWQTLVPMQTEGTRTPIFWVHGGGGTIVHFQLLARRLGADQPFYGFQLRGLYGDAAPLATVEEMAAHDIRELRTVQPHGPYVLAGYCFGILVAFEMARQLEREGERVALVIGINGGTPGYIRRYGRPRHVTWHDPVATPATRAGRAVLAMKRVKWALEPANLAPQKRLRGAARRTKLRTLRQLVRLCAAIDRPIPDAIRGEGVYEACHWAEAHYRPDRHDVRMLLFTAPELFRTRDLGWGELVGGELIVEQLPGHHETQRDAMYEPMVARVAERIRTELERALGNSPG
jgi:thioesterase domain-containing protein